EVSSEFTVAEPALTKRGLHGSFATVAGACSGQWDKVKLLVSHGHEIDNHSWDHECLTTDATLAKDQCNRTTPPTSINFALEVDQSTKAFETNLGMSIEYFVMPFDACDPATIAYLKKKGYLGARCGDPGPNLANFTDS